MGFEPTTPTLARLCSTPELHPHSVGQAYEAFHPPPQEEKYTHLRFSYPLAYHAASSDLLLKDKTTATP